MCYDCCVVKCKNKYLGKSTVDTRLRIRRTLHVWKKKHLCLFNVLLLPLPVFEYCQSDPSFSPSSFYLLHLSLCTPGRGSGAFCLAMWAELLDALHGAALNIAEQLRTDLPVEKLQMKSLSNDITGLILLPLVFIFKKNDWLDCVVHACNEAFLTLNLLIVHNCGFPL